MYTLSRITRAPMARRRPATYWQASEDFFRPFVEMVNSPMRTNVKETDDAYIFEAELPGFELSEIDLTIQDGLMTIVADHKENAEASGQLSSNRYVQRSFTVEDVQEEAVAAQYKNGILTVTLPKVKTPEAPQPRKILITD